MSRDTCELCRELRHLAAHHARIATIASVRSEPADVQDVIRIRRVPARGPVALGPVYEVEVAAHGMPRHYKRTRSPNWLLEPILGRGDACDVVREADRQWARGVTGWAVQFDEDGLPS